jgi:hypothetical protein
MMPVDFKERLAALVPRPRLHLVRFHGVLAPNAKLRALIVPRAPGSACPRHDCRTQRGADAAASGNNDPAWFFAGSLFLAGCFATSRPSFPGHARARREKTTLDRYSMCRSRRVMAARCMRMS